MPIVGFKIRPLYIAACLAGLAAGFWHLVLSPKWDFDSGDEAQHYGLQHPEDFELAKRLSKSKEISSLTPAEIRTVHTWCAYNKSTIFSTLVLSQFTTEKLMSEFIPDLKSMLAIGGMRGLVAAVVDVWKQRIGPAFIESLHNVGNGELGVIAGEVVHAR